jgi:hypothetical protein
MISELAGASGLEIISFHEHQKMVNSARIEIYHEGIRVWSKNPATSQRQTCSLQLKGGHYGPEERKIENQEQKEN